MLFKFPLVITHYIFLRKSTMRFVLLCEESDLNGKKDMEYPESGVSGSKNIEAHLQFKMNRFCNIISRNFCRTYCNFISSLNSWFVWLFLPFVLMGTVWFKVRGDIIFLSFWRRQESLTEVEYYMEVYLWYTCQQLVQLMVDVSIWWR